MHQKNQQTFLNGLANVQNINADKLNVSSVTGMFAMFDGCSNLTQLDVSNWNTSNVTNMGALFHSCISLTSIGDLSNWDVSKVTNMWAMFYNCSSLTQLDASKWNVSNVTKMHQMFSGCRSLTQLDLSNWDTTNVANMNSMFYGCSNLTSIGDLSGWNVSKVTNMSGMFYGCISLTEINLNNWDMRNVTNVENMFNECDKLEEIYTPKVLPEDNTAITLPKAYRDINKPEENTSYKSIQKSNNKFSQSIHLVDGIIVTFDVDFAKNYFKNEYTDNLKPRFYKKSEVLQFGNSQETGEKLLPSTTADGKAILWDEEALENETGYEFLGWECSYDYKYYDIPFVANYFPADVVYVAIFNDKNVVKYDLELSNLCKETGKLLPKAQYNIEGAGRDSVLKREYIVSESGTVKIEDLYANEEYTLTEKRPSEGYNIQTEPIKFKAVRINSEWQFEIISGKLKSHVIEPSTDEGIKTNIKIEWEDEILFKVRKVDSENNQLGLQGAKFTIKYKNNDKWEYAKDINGNLIGKQENINGEQMYVVTTDENGYIFEEVIPGEYQVTEIDAPEGYKMPENPVQYLNIEILREEQLKVTESWAVKFASSSADVLERVLLTDDGGRIFVGSAGEIISDEGVVISPGGSNLVVKYNEKGQRTWGGDFKYGYPNMVTETKDNGLLILGNSGMAKYKKNELYGTPGQEEYVIEWESTIITDTSKVTFRYITETSDNGFVVQGRMDDTIELIDTNQPITLNKKGTQDIFIIKYEKVQEGEYIVEWTDTIETGGDPYMTALLETSDKGILLGGAVKGYVTLPDGKKLTNTKTIDNTLLIKYTKKENGESGYDFKWARRVIGDNNKITGITETTDGKYVLAGYLGGTIEIPGIVGSVSTKGGLDNLVIVFDKDGNTLVQGLKQIGGTGGELLNHVARTNDGGFVTVGSISSDVTLENGQEIRHNQSGDSVTDGSQRDAIVTRYDKNMNTLWARTYGGTLQDHFTSVFVDKDNNILIGTYFKSSGIKLENQEVSGGYLEGFEANNVDSAMIQLKEYIDVPQSINTQYIEIPGEAIPNVDIEVEKRWDNINNKYVKPASVTIELTTNIAGVEEKEEITLTKENKITPEGEPENYETWRYIITKPQCTKYGEKIVYTIKEKSYTLE